MGRICSADKVVTDENFRDFPWRKRLRADEGRDTEKRTVGSLMKASSFSIPPTALLVRKFK